MHQYFNFKELNLKIIISLIPIVRILIINFFSLFLYSIIIVRQIIILIFIFNFNYRVQKYIIYQTPDFYFLVVIFKFIFELFIPNFYLIMVTLILIMSQFII